MMEIGEVKEGITNRGRPKTIKKVNQGVWHIEHPGDKHQPPYTVVITRDSSREGKVQHFGMQYFHITDVKTPNGSSRKNYELVKVGHRPAGFYMQITQDKYSDLRIAEISDTDKPLETVSIEYRTDGAKIRRVKTHTARLHGLL